MEDSKREKNVKMRESWYAQCNKNMMPLEKMDINEKVKKQYVMERAEEPETVLFDGFEEMDYALFLETKASQEMTSIYYRYGIYGDFTETVEDGENVYFQLTQKITGDEIYLLTEREWRKYSGERIVSMSLNLDWIISRSWENSGNYVERWYQNGREVKRLSGNSISDMRPFVAQKNASGEYEPIPEQTIQAVQQLLEDTYKMIFGEHRDRIICFDDNGSILAVSEMKDDDCEHYYSFGEKCIRIYDISEERIEKLCELSIPEAEEGWPVEISQIVGNKEEGWLIFSSGDSAYRMNYPGGETEKIGEFMYGTVYSPDGKYRAYCTGYDELFDCWEYLDDEDEKLQEQYYEMRECWSRIPLGWYVEELETGNKTYIPTELATFDINMYRPLYGGHCVWIEKAKLLQILSQ